jgi:hypothetical protein
VLINENTLALVLGPLVKEDKYAEGVVFSQEDPKGWIFRLDMESSVTENTENTSIEDLKLRISNQHFAHIRHCWRWVRDSSAPLKPQEWPLEAEDNLDITLDTLGAALCWYTLFLRGTALL